MGSTSKVAAWKLNMLGEQNPFYFEDMIPMDPFSRLPRLNNLLRLSSFSESNQRSSSNPFRQYLGFRMLTRR